MISKTCALLISMTAWFVSASVTSAALRVGDILATVNLNGQGGGVVKIDPATGDRTILSGFGVGTGPSDSYFAGITADNRGNIYVITESSYLTDAAQIIKINSLTGDRDVLSSDSVGAGMPLGNMQPGIEWLNGRLIAASDRVFEVDTITGDRELISSALAPSRGSGDSFTVYGLASDLTGQILATDYGVAAVVRIDPVTGDRSLVSQDMGRGDGPEFSAPTGIVVDRFDGTVYVSDFERNRVFQVDPVTGDRTVVFDSPLLFPFDLTQLLSGELLTIDRWSGEEIIAVEPESGLARSISTLVTGSLSSTVGAGPVFFSAGGLFVVESIIPEPTSLVLLTVLIPLAGRARLGRL